MLQLGKVSEEIFIDNLSRESEDLGEILDINNAVWHKAWRNKHDQQKVDRALKDLGKRQSTKDTNPNPVKTRRSISQDDVKGSKNKIEEDRDTEGKPCLICNIVGEKDGEDVTEQQLWASTKEYGWQRRSYKTQNFWQNFQRVIWWQSMQFIIYAV